MSKTRKIDWLNHFLEFIVVVIGILLAFQLNTCREEGKEQSLLQEHIENMVVETKFNKTNLENSIVASQRLLDKLDSIVTYISEEKEVTKINELALGLLSLDYTYLKKNAYNSLVETGDIRFIEDFDLKNNIVMTYEYYNWIEGVETMARTTYAEQYFPYVVENLDLITYQPQDIELYTSKKFMNYLSVYQYSIKHRMQKQQDALEIITKFLEDLEKKT